MGREEKRREEKRREEKRREETMIKIEDKKEEEDWRMEKKMIRVEEEKRRDTWIEELRKEVNKSFIRECPKDWITVEPIQDVHHSTQHYFTILSSHQFETDTFSL